MARRPIQEGCLLCSPGEPCELHEPAPEKPKAPRKRAVKAAPPQASATEAPPAPVAVEPDPTPTPVSNSDAMRAAMRRRVTTSTAPEPAPTPVQPPVDTVLEDAIRALAPILDPVELRTYKDVIARPFSAKGRARAWKERIRS